MADLKLDRRSKGYKLARADLDFAVAMLLEALRDIHAPTTVGARYVHPESPIAEHKVTTFPNWKPFEYARFALREAELACDTAQAAIDRCGVFRERR